MAGSVHQQQRSIFPLGRWVALAALATILIAAAVLGLAPIDNTTLVTDAIQSVGHFVFFGLVAFLVAICVQFIPTAWAKRRIWQYVCGLTAGIACGILLEFLQSFVPERNPSIGDVISDSLGAVAAIAVLILLDRPGVGASSRRLLTTTALMVLVITSTLGAWPLVEFGSSLRARGRLFPKLVSFHSRPMQIFTDVDKSVSLQPIDTHRLWPEETKKDMAKLTIRPTRKRVGFGIREPYPDWRDYQRLEFDVLNLQQQAVTAVLRVHDFQHNDEYEDRFNQVIRLRPGFQTVSIPVSDIQRGPSSRELDLASVDEIRIYVAKPSERLEFIFGNFRLEK